MNTFIPPYCPNQHCVRHQPGPTGYHEWIRFGTHTSKLSGRIHRYRCSVCRKTFSEQTFSPTRYLKRPADFEALATELTRGQSLRAIGRACSLSCASVSTRLARMAIGYTSAQGTPQSPAALPSGSRAGQPEPAFSQAAERSFSQAAERSFSSQIEAAPFQADTIWLHPASVVSEPEGNWPAAEAHPGSAGGAQAVQSRSACLPAE